MADETLKGLEVAILVTDGHKQAQRAAWEPGNMRRAGGRKLLMKTVYTPPSSLFSKPRTATD
jgi:hypothetical protein